MRGGLVGFVRYKYKSGIHPGKTPNDEVNQNGRFPLGMDRRTAPIVLSGAVFLAIATAGWLVLRTLRTGGLEITPNWLAIAAFGVPLVSLAFLLVWLFLRFAVLEAAPDATSTELEIGGGLESQKAVRVMPARKRRAS